MSIKGRLSGVANQLVLRAMLRLISIVLHFWVLRKLRASSMGVVAIGNSLLQLQKFPFEVFFKPAALRRASGDASQSLQNSLNIVKLSADPWSFCLQCRFGCVEYLRVPLVRRTGALHSHQLARMRRLCAGELISTLLARPGALQGRWGLITVRCSLQNPHKVFSKPLSVRGWRAGVCPANSPFSGRKSSGLQVARLLFGQL